MRGWRDRFELEELAALDSMIAEAGEVFHRWSFSGDFFTVKKLAGIADELEAENARLTDRVYDLEDKREALLRERTAEKHNSQFIEAEIARPEEGSTGG